MYIINILTLINDGDSNGGEFGIVSLLFDLVLKFTELIGFGGCDSCGGGCSNKALCCSKSFLKKLKKKIKKNN